MASKAFWALNGKGTVAHCINKANKYLPKGAKLRYTSIAYKKYMATSICPNAQMYANKCCRNCPNITIGSCI